MALTLGQGAQVMASVGYYNRIRAAMVREARTVAAQLPSTQLPIGAPTYTPSTAEFAKRKALAYRVMQNPDGHVNAFLSAYAADSAASLTWFQPVNIASSTNANPSVVTTNIAHGLVPGDVVEIANHLVNLNINGVWTLATASGSTFTVPFPATAAGLATGYVMKMDTDITVNITLQNAFNSIAGTYATESA